jgi:hypothetical protein
MVSKEPVMKKRSTRKGERELADRLHAQRREPVEWEQVGAEPTAQRGVLTSFRLSPAEFVALQKAAKAHKETLSEFIRKAVATRIQGAAGEMDVTVGMTGAVVVQPVTAGRTGRTENRRILKSKTPETIETSGMAAAS